VSDTATLAVEAALTVERDGTTFDVWTDGDCVVVNAPSFAALRTLRSLRSPPTGPFGSDALVRDLITDNPVELRVRHATIGRVGGETPASPLARRLTGFDARFDVRGALVAAVRALG